MPADCASPASSPDSLQQDCKSRSAPRSRHGCWTCRKEQVKCDEQQPRCARCIRLQRHCDYVPRPRKKIGPKWLRERLRNGTGNQTALGADLGGSIQPVDDDISSPSDKTVKSVVPSSEVSRTVTTTTYKEKSCVLVQTLSPLSLTAACSLILSPSDHEAISLLSNILLHGSAH